MLHRYKTAAVPFVFAKRRTVRRLLPVGVEDTGFLRGFHLSDSRGADYAILCCGWCGEGRQDAACYGKKCEHGCSRFFLPCRPRPRGAGCSPPFEALKDGFGTGTTAGSGGSKPVLFLLKGGKHAGEGGDYFGPPHTIGFIKVGLSLSTPTAHKHLRKCIGMRGVGRGAGVFCADF